MAKRIIMINDGKIETYHFSSTNLKLCENLVNQNNINHYLCFDCKNALSHKCQKIFDKRKIIRKYSFITKGYQSGNMLAVYGCKNFVKDNRKG